MTWLKREGYTVIDQNASAKTGEIDIIATKEGVYHFIEVKSGKGFDPVYNLTPAKLSKVIRTAQGYLQKKRIDAAFCIDAAIVRDGEIEFLENVTV